MSSAHVSIVVPCYNEAGRLPVDEFLQFARRDRAPTFLMVNDGSTDSTLSLLHGLAARMPERFSVRDLPRNMGKAEAVRQGMLDAFHSGSNYAGFWDADLATPLETIVRFEEALDRRPDVLAVIGTRLPLLGRQIHRKPLRKLLGRAFATAASRTLGLRIYDTQCGAKMFRNTPDVVSLFHDPFDSRWIFDVEILARLIRDRRVAGQIPAEQVLYELPLDTWLEVPGSKVRLRDFGRAALELATIRRKYLGKQRYAERQVISIPETQKLPDQRENAA